MTPRWVQDSDWEKGKDFDPDVLNPEERMFDGVIADVERLVWDRLKVMNSLPIESMTVPD